MEMEMEMETAVGTRPSAVVAAACRPPEAEEFHPKVEGSSVAVTVFDRSCLARAQRGSG
jgi:hypothetical protein